MTSFRQEDDDDDDDDLNNNNVITSHMKCCINSCFDVQTTQLSSLHRL